MVTGHGAERQMSEQNEHIESKPHSHSKIITGFRTLDDKLFWGYGTRNIFPHEDENIEVRFFILMRDTPAPQKGDAIRTLLKQMENSNVPWLVPDRKEWAFDLDSMKEVFKDLQEVDWCNGRVYLEPEFEVKKEDVDISNHKYYQTYIVFYINQEALGMTPLHTIPPEIQSSLRDFRLDHPDPKKVAFIMMKFGKTTAHDKIVQGIRDALAPHGISAVRADDRDYHTDLYPNILTYLYGCGFAIAVFERIEKDDFNPNVSLEVGYLLAMGREICLLKDQTLPLLQTDLVGKLYRTFDPLDPGNSIPPVLTKWMRDRRII
jgi:hypothetical protein